jgi:hypothetical protein
VVTNVYVDSFNLYYGCLKGTPYRWLDIAGLCHIELPHNQINRIRFFTALVDARPGDPQQPVRQQTYLRALKTIPNLTMHYGQFLRNAVRMPLVSPPAGGPNTVEVWKTEEKGSDVNLACYLLLDAFQKDCEAAAIISNDSDLAEPLRLARKHFGIKVIVLHPLRAPLPGKKPRPNFELVKAASKSKIIQQASLAASQFPPTLTDAIGTITKPAGW